MSANVNSHCPNPFEGWNWGCVKNSYLKDNFFLISLCVRCDNLIESLVPITLPELLSFMYIYASMYRGICAFCHGFFPDWHQKPDFPIAAANLCFSEDLPSLRRTCNKCLSFKEESRTTRKQIQHEGSEIQNLWVVILTNHLWTSLTACDCWGPGPCTQSYSLHDLRGQLSF